MHAIYIYKKKCTAGEHGKDAKVSMVVQVYEGCESKRGSTSVRTMRCHEESKGSCKKKRRETSTPCEMKNEMKRPEWNGNMPEAEYNGPKGERTERTELWMMKRRMIVMKETQMDRPEQPTNNDSTAWLRASARPVPQPGRAEADRETG